ncbi:MAG TPA: peptidylprolyl isomerase [Longimicrobiales bacterium]|nr:peptidylprolyl isomerase [Longimicrobiales bacterium]
MTRRILTVLALLVAAPAAAQDPQPPGPEVVDRIVAVVGDSIVLESDILAEIERLRASGVGVPAEDVALAEFRRDQLESLVNELIILQAAERDSIFVLQEDVQVQVDAQVAQLERQFGGRPALEAAMAREGLTIESYRATMVESLRRNQIRRQYMAVLQRDRRPPPVTDAEVSAFFAERAGTLGMRPATVEFRQVVVAPEASDSARAAALEEARRVLAELQDGADFALLARRHSDDPGSSQRGGELGWFRRGRFVPAFDRIAFALRQGELSPIVETPFGYHIIRVDKVRGPERQARHILIRPEVSEADQARTASRAEEVAERLRAGASMDSLISAVHDETEETRVGPALMDSLPAPYNARLADVEAGQVVAPFEIPGTGKYAVVRVVARRAAGPYSADDPDVRDQIRSALQQEKLLEEVITELRRRTYIDIRY